MVTTALKTQYYGPQQPHPQYQQYPQPQPYQQYPMYPPYAQAPGSMPPPPGEPKRKIWPIIVTIVVVIVVVLAVVLVFLLQLKTMTYKEFILEYDKNGDGDLTTSDYPITPKTLKEGDTVNINDKVARVETASQPSYGTVTGLWMESTENTNFEEIPLVLSGNKSGQYHVGDTVTIPLHLKKYVIYTETMVIPEEWYIWMGGMIIVDGGSTEPNVNIADGESTGTAGQWKLEVASVSSAESLGNYKVAVLNGTSIAISATSLDTVKSGGASGGGLTLTFSDATDDDKLNGGDWFTLSGTDDTSDYQIVLYWKASGNKVSGNTGKIEQ